MRHIENRENYAGVFSDFFQRLRGAGPEFLAFGKVIIAASLLTFTATIIGAGIGLAL